MTGNVMYLYPWDLRAEGTGDVLSRLGDAGIDGIALAAAYHSGRFLRPHGPRRKVYFPEGGTVYFTPDPGLYGRLQPRMAEEARFFDGFAELARHGGFAVAAWTVGLHNSRMGQQHPDLAAQTPYGDPLFNSLCPAQPEVRDYLAALCRDAANQPGVSEILLETPGWQVFRHGHHHEFELIELPDRVQLLMGLCFCTACRAGLERCGVDADRLAARTLEELDSFFETAALPPTDPWSDPDWQGFHDWREGCVASLVGEVRAALPDGTRLAVIPTTRNPNRLCRAEGSDPASLARAADRLEVQAYCRGVPGIVEDAVWVRETAGPDARIGFVLRPSWPDLTDGGQVREAVSRLRQLNPTSLAFSNYGHMRLRSLDWIRAALAP
ncbi:hypothetical protein [Oceaniglobus roseus]|uniref:hypothetical protein n=1 Tax=Oceaniglobus roseus TaxID=1737570 RepID=UPI000C7EC7AB|nr:hypothetical protein [Kandeliimicrobium roseum]